MRGITKTALIIGGGVLLALLSFIISPDVGAFSLREGVDAARGNNQPADLLGATGIFTTLVNLLLFVVGALSIVMLIVGGIRYTVSGGNATSVASAKNTIVYAIVGLVIAFLAFAAVNFILTTLAPGTGTAGYTDI